MVKAMKSIDVLMVILLVIFVGSLVGLIIYGEVWRINLSMTDTQIESFDAVQTRNAFILSAVSMASGGSMLYILVTRFSQEEEKKEAPASGNADE
jgi:phage shock protein PspC (stress-responsive transcriptional regulator)